jgi:hypothetical protein
MPPQTSSLMQRAPNSQENRRRWSVRCFFFFMVFCMVRESVPDANCQQLFHDSLTRTLNRLGLWQRPWKLFAPNPVQETSWVSAEIFWNDQTQTTWSSPDWQAAPVREKFLRFRHLNYYNRFQEPLSPLITNDLADWICRNAAPETGDLQPPVPAASQVNPPTIESIKLYLNRSKMLLPHDGSLPTRAETYQMFTVQPLATKIYTP